MATKGLGNLKLKETCKMALLIAFGARGGSERMTKERGTFVWLFSNKIANFWRILWNYKWEAVMNFVSLNTHDLKAY